MESGSIAVRIACPTIAPESGAGCTIVSAAGEVTACSEVTPRGVRTPPK